MRYLQILLLCNILNIVPSLITKGQNEHVWAKIKHSSNFQDVF